MKKAPDSRKKETDSVLNDRKPNFRDKDGRKFLVRCYVCDPIHGRENWAPAVATGVCAWCGCGF